MQAKDFGPGFHWGVAASAYQTEGGYNEDGKGLSIWDVFTTIPGKAKGNANTGCDFYNRYAQDLILMNYMNVRNFRFSLSWSRLIPQGTGTINEQGVDFYNRVIDFCLELGITPWITLYHWDLPHGLEQRGGWTNRNIIHWFADYVRLCLDRFGDRVKHWMILNEPLAFTGAGYFLGLHAPGKKGLNNFLPAMHHATLCQGIGGQIVKGYTGMQAGTCFSCAPIYPVNDQPQHIEPANTVDVVTNRMFLEPLLGRGYPVDDFRLLSQLEKYFFSGDETLMQCDMDFIGVQNYTREVVKYAPFVPYLKSRIVQASKRQAACTAMDWEIYPEGIYEMLKKFASYPEIKKIIITENGAAFHDVVVRDEVHDPDRLLFLQTYLGQVLKARNEGVPVEGYFAWSFTDNFEWTEGFDKRFGLVYVDYDSGRRIIKSSGKWFRALLQPSIVNHAQLRVSTLRHFR